jgi:RNA polymerase sigma factor (sigma-70 family)
MGSASWPAGQLISSAQAGDRAAIEALVSGSHPHVRRFAHSLCSTPQDAEDAAQEALVVLFRKVGTLRGSAALSSWLFRIVLNECIRRARLSRFRTGFAVPHEASAEERAIDRIDTERVTAAIASLPAEERSVLILRDIQGLSGSAAAEALGLSNAAMKSRLHRARTHLRECLEPLNDDLHEGAN